MVFPAKTRAMQKGCTAAEADGNLKIGGDEALMVLNVSGVCASSQLV